MTVLGRPRHVPDAAKDLIVIDGLVPPHDLDAEAAVLSACMLAQRDALGDCADILQANHFYSGAHQRIYEAILELDAVGRPIDAVTVGSQLKERGRLPEIGGIGYLSTVLHAAPAILNCRTYAKTVVGHWKLRQGILLCRQFAARGYDRGGQTEAFLAELEAEIFKLAAARSTERSIEIHPLLSQVYETISKAYSDGRPPGIATGFAAADDLTAGLHRKDLTLVAARPGVGKTSYKLAIALNVAASPPLLIGDDGQKWQPQGVVFFSLEMPREQIGQRIIAVDSQVSAQRLRTGRVNDADWGPMTWSCQRLAKVPIVIDDTSSLSITQARTAVRRVKAGMAKKGVRLVLAIFDYLQLMSGESGKRETRREEEIGIISRGLKGLAKDEDIAVMAGCQLNRAIESRSGNEKRPRISDLRESGNLEQDADNIIALHRPAMYGERDPDGEEGRTEMIFLKQRNGPTGTAVIRYVPGCTRFEPMPGYG